MFGPGVFMKAALGIFILPATGASESILRSIVALLFLAVCACTGAGCSAPKPQAVNLAVWLTKDEAVLRANKLLEDAAWKSQAKKASSFQLWRVVELDRPPYGWVVLYQSNESNESAAVGLAANGLETISFENIYY
jgi:hypothetical protein